MLTSNKTFWPADCSKEFPGANREEETTALSHYLHEARSEPKSSKDAEDPALEYYSAKMKPPLIVPAPL